MTMTIWYQPDEKKTVLMNANKLSGYYINGNSIYYEPLQIYSESAMNPFGFDRNFLQKWWFKCARAWCATILKVMYNENITFRRLQEQKIITMWHLEAIKIELEVTLRSPKIKKNDPPASSRCAMGEKFLSSVFSQEFIDSAFIYKGHIALIFFVY